MGHRPMATRLAFHEDSAHDLGMRVSLFALLVCVLMPVTGFADQTETDLMAQAQRAYIAHDYDTAKDLFGQVIQIDPQNTLAIQYLRNIRQVQAGMPSPPSGDPVQSLMLKQVNLKGATFSSALDFFKQQAAAQSVTVSFVSQLPPEQMQRPITLNLTNIPFLDALTYLCQMDGATYRQDPYAIVILPASAAAAAPGQ